MSKQIKTFRISEANQEALASLSTRKDRSEGWLINKALEKYFKRVTK